MTYNLQVFLKEILLSPKIYVSYVLSALSQSQKTLVHSSINHGFTEQRLESLQEWRVQNPH